MVEKSEDDLLSSIPGTDFHQEVRESLGKDSNTSIVPRTLVRVRVRRRIVRIEVEQACIARVVPVATYIENLPACVRVDIVLFIFDNEIRPTQYPASGAAQTVPWPHYAAICEISAAVGM